MHSICNLLNEQPTAVYANARIHPKYSVDTTVAGILSFGNGVQASFDCSFDVTDRQAYQIVGSEGTIDVLSAYRPDINENGEGQIIITNATGKETVGVAGDQYKLQVEHFANAIIEDKEPSYSNEKMLQNMKVLDAAYQSIKEGKCVELS